MKNDNEIKFTYKGISFQESDSEPTSEREIHSYHEILYVIDTDARLLTENGKQHITGGAALIIIPKGCYHFFELKSSDKFKRLKATLPCDAIGDFPIAEIFSSLRIIRPISEGLLPLLEKMHSGARCDESKRGFYAYAALMMLLAELCEEGTCEKKSAKSENPIAKTAEYISSHPREPLNAEVLARRANLSVSSITHLFKKELGISLHRYVTQRRLVLAQNLIGSGHKPTEIYGEVGYKDYSSFYKAYVNYFGYPPSKNSFK